MRNKRLVRFVTVGGVCFLTNLAVLYGGTSLLGYHYLISMLVSILVANTLGWFLNRCLTFKRSRFSWRVEYLRYLSVSFTSTLISLLLMFVCVSVLLMNYLISSALIALTMLLFNYVAHRDWSFSSRKHSSTRS